jgi:hypothetical protein
MNLWILQCASLRRNLRVQAFGWHTWVPWVAAYHRVGLASVALHSELQSLEPNTHRAPDTGVFVGPCNTIDRGPGGSDAVE